MKVLIIFVAALIGASSATTADQTTINNQYAAILSPVYGNFTAYQNLFVSTLLAAPSYINSAYNSYVGALNSQRSALSGPGLTALNNYVTYVRNSNTTLNAYFTSSALTTAITTVINSKIVQYIYPINATVKAAANAAVSNNNGIICWNKYSPLIRNAYTDFLTNLNVSVLPLATSSFVDGGIILANYTGQATGPTGIQNSAWVNCQPWGWNCNPYYIALNPTVTSQTLWTQNAIIALYNAGVNKIISDIDTQAALTQVQVNYFNGNYTNCLTTGV